MNSTFYRILLLIIIFSSGLISEVYSQIHIRSSTLIEGAPVSVKPFSLKEPIPDRPNFYQTIYWRTARTKDYYEKTVYHYQSVYLRDSMIGVRVYGIDFDLMHNIFQKKGPNFFRYWNKLRMGFSLLLEKNYKHPPYAPEEAYNYLNSEGFISFLHVPHAARGDQSTRARVGSYAFYFLATSSRRFDIHFKVYPFTSTWIKFYYAKEYGINRIGICPEIEINVNHGYDKSVVHSSKDLYKGFTLIGGVEYNMNLGETLLRFGLKMDFRNH